jgi:hypothetical protein
MPEDAKSEDKKFTEELTRKGLDVINQLPPEVKKEAEKHLKQRVAIAQTFKNIGKLSNKGKEALLPPHHFVFRLLLYTLVVKYRNAGKMQISCEIVAYCPNPDPPGTPLEDSKEVLILTDGKVVDRQEFEEIRRVRWPLEHEVGRNPDNVTLGVHHGTLDGKGGIK